MMCSGFRANKISRTQNLTLRMQVTCEHINLFLPGMIVIWHPSRPARGRSASPHSLDADHATGASCENLEQPYPPILRNRSVRNDSLLVPAFSWACEATAVKWRYQRESWSVARLTARRAGLRRRQTLRPHRQMTPLLEARWRRLLRAIRVGPLLLDPASPARTLPRVPLIFHGS
jgi:hypothetical protein